MLRYHRFLWQIDGNCCKAHANCSVGSRLGNWSLPTWLPFRPSTWRLRPETRICIGRVLLASTLGTFVGVEVRRWLQRGHSSLACQNCAQSKILSDQHMLQQGYELMSLFVSNLWEEEVFLVESIQSLQYKMHCICIQWCVVCGRSSLALAWWRYVLVFASWQLACLICKGSLAALFVALFVSWLRFPF